MRHLWILSLVILFVQQCVAPPVAEKKGEPVNEEDVDKNIEYHTYLKEVVQVLESDPEFRAKLDKVNEDDLKSGKIAHELDFVSHQVRTQLDELKRLELERLRRLATKEYEIENGIDLDHLKIAEHVDHSNPHTFEVDDLKKLIAKTTEDLAEADRKRRIEFKEYEMQKKFEQEEKMKKLNEEEKKKYAEELKTLEEKHKKHKPLHHPGSKQQLEEVWEKQDHMDTQDFDPRTFFYLHDLDGNGVWDQDEVKILFLKELDKLYYEGATKDDIRERAEEMERMREHVFNEADLNKDGLISFNEFSEQTKKPEFQQDQGWKSLDEQQIYSQQEYEAFERARQENIQRQIARGILPPNQGNYDPGHPQQFPPHQGQVPVEHAMPNHQQQPQYVNHGQLQEHPQQFQGQPQQQYHHQGQVPQYQGQVPQYQGQVPLYQGQVPQYQGQVPQYQGHPAQGQVPPQQQQAQHAQVPVGQATGGQVPLQHGQQQQYQEQHGQAPVQHAQQQQHQEQHGQAPIQHGQENQHNQIPPHVQHGQVPQQQPNHQASAQQQQNIQTPNVPQTQNKQPQQQVPHENAPAPAAVPSPSVSHV